MPYIKPERRKRYDAAIDFLLDALPNSNWEGAGDFTYIIYRLLKRFNKDYTSRALGTGCLEMAKQEMYRKSHADYEEEKRKLHGEV